MSTETWTVAVSRRANKFDALWKSSEGRYAQTDGTHPNNVEGDMEGYILDLEVTKSPVIIGHGWFFPHFRTERSIRSCAIFQAYFLKEGIITAPIVYQLPSPEEA